MFVPNVEAGPAQQPRVPERLRRGQQQQPPGGGGQRRHPGQEPFGDPVGERTRHPR